MIQHKFQISAVIFLLSSLLFISGCYVSPYYNMAEEEYIEYYILKDVSDSTSTNLDFSQGELTHFNAKTNLLGAVSEDSIYTFLHLIDPFTGSITAVGSMGVLPYDRTSHLFSKTYNPDGTIEYFRPFNDDFTFLDVESRIWGYDEDDNFDNIYKEQYFEGPLDLGQTYNANFFSQILYFTEPYLNNTLGGEYALTLKSVLYPTEVNYVIIQDLKDRSMYPVLKEYINGVQVSTDEFDEYHHEKYRNPGEEIGELFTLTSGDTYSFNLHMPSYDDVRNYTIEGETTISSSKDYEFPHIEFIESESYYNSNQDKILKFRIIENNLGSQAQLSLNTYYKTDGSWIEIQPTINYPEVEVNLGQISSESISFRVDISLGESSIYYTIEPIAIKQREISDLDFAISSEDCIIDPVSPISTKCVLDLSGTCTDNLGANCGKLPFYFYVDGAKIIPIRFTHQEIDKDFFTSGDHELKVVYEGIPESAYPAGFESNTITLNFDEPGILITGNYEDYPIDTDGDGLYDYLAIDSDVQVTEPGYYHLTSQIYLGERDEITHSSHSEPSSGIYLIPGTHTLTSLHPGSNIYRAGLDGPYELVSMCAREETSRIHCGNFPFVTSSYKYSDFQHENIVAEFTGDYDYLIEDLNDDGKYELLKWNAEVEIYEEGEYSLSGHLRTPGGDIIYSFFNDGKQTLKPGTHTLKETFRGKEIYNSLGTGQYELVSIELKRTDGAYSYETVANDFPNVFTEHISHTDFDQTYCSEYNSEIEEITTDTWVCPKKYYLDNGVKILADNIKFNCHDAEINGIQNGAGIDLTQRSGVTIYGCTIKEYIVGINMYLSNDNIIKDNTIINELIGIGTKHSHDNIFDNNKIVGKDNPLVGLSIYNANNNEFNFNEISNNQRGVDISHLATGNTFSNNKICLNEMDMKCSVPESTFGSANRATINDGCTQVQTIACKDEETLPEIRDFPETLEDPEGIENPTIPIRDEETTPSTKTGESITKTEEPVTKKVPKLSSEKSIWQRIVDYLFSESI